MKAKVKSRRQDHFREMLNRPVPPETAETETDDASTLTIKKEPPNIDGIRSVVRVQK
jgi:hypothetical protein